MSVTEAPSSQRAVFLCLSLFCLIVICAGCAGLLPTGFSGVIAFIMALGGVLNALGERLGWIRNYLGGGPIVVIFGSSLMVAVGLIPESLSQNVTVFVRDQGFLTLFISALISGSLLGMDRDLLLKSAVWFFPVILGGVVCALIFAGAAGFLIGSGFTEAIFFVGLPIMGGGMGAGAVPLAEIFARVIDSDSTSVLSKMMPAVVLGNLFAIIAAGLLEKLGKNYTCLSGDGRLMKGQAKILGHSEENESVVCLARMGSGLFVSTSFYVAGYLLSYLLPLHPYALMILCVGVVKATGVMPDYFEESAALWGNFMVLALTPALLACIGIGFTDLQQVAMVISVPYVFLVVATVTGAVIGAGTVGRLLGFYPIEASITAGLCMANMGGTGDIAVLSASRRMNLMPFAQISSRMGGAMILLLATALMGLV